MAWLPINFADECARNRGLQEEERIMLSSIVAALALVQPVATPPVRVALQVAEVGSAGDRAALNRLLFQTWNGRGNMRAVVQSGPDRWSACVTRGQPDVACVQRSLPTRKDGLPVVALFITPSNNGVHRHIIKCIGANGSGRGFVASLAAINGPGVLSRQKNNDRTAVRGCIHAAAPGSVTGSVW